MSVNGVREIQKIVAQRWQNRRHHPAVGSRPDITAVITVEEDYRFLPDTLEAVFSQTILPGTVIIADCSGQGGPALRTTFPIHDIPAQSGEAAAGGETDSLDVQIIRIASAHSFSDAVMRTLRNAQVDTSTKSLWLLHDDSRPQKDNCLETLLDAWCLNPTASLLGCKQLQWETDNLHNVGAYAGMHTIDSLVVDGEPDQEQYDTRSDVFAVSLAGALIPVNALQGVKGIDQWFSTFGEADDFCRRLSLNGKRVLVVPDARIAHLRARVQGMRSKEGKPLELGSCDLSMQLMAAQQKYWYTDMSAALWPFAWLYSLLASLLYVVRCLFQKKPYEAWCHFCMPWIALAGIPSALAARHRIRQLTTVSRKQLMPLTADHEQIKQWKARCRAFESQQSIIIINPLALEHLRHRRVIRWTFAIIAALLAFGIVVACYWHIFLNAWSGASLYSNQLIPTGANFRQLVDAATTAWVFGANTPAPPTPWLLVLMVVSVFTGGNVPQALALIFFLAAPGCVLSFWALAGVLTRSDAVRVISALLWFALAMAFGLFSSANLPMLTVMVFMPAAFACSFKAVGMYRTEAPLDATYSVQYAAVAALLFIPVVAAEPQLLLTLIVIFFAFLVFVRRHRLMLFLIPFPAAFALAPTLVNAVRYADKGMLRQLFGSIMLPVGPSNANPQILNLSQLVQRSFGLTSSAGLQWFSTPRENMASMATLETVEIVAFVVILALVLALSLCSLLQPRQFRPARILWTILLSGLLLALVAAAIAIADSDQGAAAASVLPGMSMALMAMLASVCLLCGPAVTQFIQLKSDKVSASKLGVAAKTLICAVLAAGACLSLTYGIQERERGSVAVSSNGLPVVAQDYLQKNPDSRILAVTARNANAVDYAVMRTARGELIDSSPVQRLRVALGEEKNPQNEQIAQLAARFMGNSDSEAIEKLQKMGFGGIYVVLSHDGKEHSKASEQLLSNISASGQTQEVVSNNAGSYFRILSPDGKVPTITTKWQTDALNNAWRNAWLWCLGIMVLLYLIVSIPRSRHYAKEEA